MEKQFKIHFIGDVCLKESASHEDRTPDGFADVRQKRALLRSDERNQTHMCSGIESTNTHCLTRLVCVSCNFKNTACLNCDLMVTVKWDEDLRRWAKEQPGQPFHSVFTWSPVTVTMDSALLFL